MNAFRQVAVVLLIIVVFIVLGFGVRSCGIAVRHVTNSMENAVVSYDEYQDIYATCTKLNEDLGVIKETPDSDPQFDQFSKAQRINQIKMNLNRWINEYNSKSKHIDKKWWKSDELPYKLETNQFTNY